MVVILNESLIGLRTFIDSKSAECLLDSLASHKVLALDWCWKQGIKVDKDGQFRVKLADGQEVPAVGKTYCLVDLGPMKTALTFYILDYDVPCVLGIPFLQTVNPTINWVACSVQVHIVSGQSPLEVITQDDVPQCKVVSAKKFERGLKKDQYLVNGCFGFKPDGQLMFTHRHAFVETGRDQPISQKFAQECLQDLKSQFSQIFSEPTFPIVHDSSVHFEHKIRLKDENTPPPHQKIYPLDYQELSKLKNSITDMLRKKQIRPSDSPYGAPILFTKKKDGHLKLYIDYQTLNQNTIVDSYPLPYIDELLSRLQGAKYFFKLDLLDRYFHIPIVGCDAYKTAFSCRYGTYEYKVIPFGLMNAPRTFQRIMN